MPPLSDIPPFSSPLPSADLEPLGDDWIETEETFLKAWTDDMVGKHQDKQGEISLDVHVWKEEMVDSRIKPERRVHELPRAGTDVEALGQPRFLSRKIQITAANGCMQVDGSSELGGFCFSSARYRDET